MQETFFAKKQTKKFQRYYWQKYLMISISNIFYEPHPIPVEKKLDITFSSIYYNTQ